MEYLVPHTPALLIGAIVIFIFLLLPSAWIDVKKRILPDSLTLGALGLLLIIRAYQGELLKIETILLLAAGSGSFALLALFYKERLGWGDVKLSGVLALGLGYFPWVLMVFISSMSGLIYLLFRYKGNSGKFETLPLGSFMIIISIILLAAMILISTGVGTV